MPSPTTPLVDHIVVLIPHSFLSSPPPWFADLFHFYPGGRHADGLTENTLALLPDGSYLEFIAFVPGVDPARRAAHQWGAKKEGTVVDWAVTLPFLEGEEGERGEGEREKVGTEELRQEKAFREVQQRVRDANSGIVYGDPVRGGRTRLDGAVLKWAVAFPKHGADGTPINPGTVPFWCLDATPRPLRVPYREPGVAKHPTGVVGVAGIEITTGAGESARVVYDVLLGKGGEDEDEKGWYWGVGASEKVHADGVVRLRSAVGEAEERVNIAFFTDNASLAGKEVGGRVDENHELVFRLVAVCGKSG